MPIVAETHTWTQTSWGVACITCSAIMLQPLIAQYAPNDNDAQMADIGDDQSIWNAAWQQVPVANQES